MRFLKFVFIITIITFSFCLGGFFFITQQPWIDFSLLDYYNPGKPSIVYDDNGIEWTRFQLDKREIIHFQDIPDYVIKAFLAAEDWNFFNHNGISFKGILRSLLVNIYNRRKVQGASTITQQLAKLLYFDAQKSYSRKIKEQIIALIIERQFTKEHILETYLNHICFGAAIYGAEAASQRFWGKHLKDVTLDQAAVLAGIVRCPQRYCPLFHKEACQQRRNVVLQTMSNLKLITAEQHEHAKQQPVNIIKHDHTIIAPHLREAIRIFLEELFGKQKLYSGGLKIHTTLNTATQEAAQTQFKKHINEFKKTVADIDGALIAIEGKTGAIKALIGGYNFSESQFNRAFMGKRQMGSTIKPLIYAAAIKAGISLADTAIDEPLSILDNNKEWCPRNFNHQFLGRMTLARALSTSNNIIAIKTLLVAGATTVIESAQKCGIKGPLYPYPSLALGCIDGTILEAAAMMNVFAHHGDYIEPHFISCIKDEWDTKIWRHTPKRNQALPTRVSDQVGKVLTLIMDRLKKRDPAPWLSCEALGKTGTTNDARTCWFTGATPNLTTAVYIGCDDNRPLGDQVLAIKTAFPLWLDFNKALPIKEKEFLFDPNLREITIDQRTGYLASAADPESITILIDN